VGRRSVDPSPDAHRFSVIAATHSVSTGVLWHPFAAASATIRGTLVRRNPARPCFTRDSCVSARPLSARHQARRSRARPTGSYERSCSCGFRSPDQPAAWTRATPLTSRTSTSPTGPKAGWDRWYGAGRVVISPHQATRPTAGSSHTQRPIWPLAIVLRFFPRSKPESLRRL